MATRNSVMIALYPKYPTRHVVDKALVGGPENKEQLVTGANFDLNDKFVDFFECFSDVQLRAVMETSIVAIYDETSKKYYQLNEENCTEQWNLAVAGETPTVEAKDSFGVRKLDAFCSTPYDDTTTAETDILGKKLGDIELDDVDVYANVMRGTILHVTGFTGFNSAVEKEQSGYYFVFKFDKTAAEEQGYSNIKFMVVGGSGKEVDVDATDNLNIVWLGSTPEEVYRKTLALKAHYTETVEEGVPFETDVLVSYDNKLQCVDYEQALTDTSLSDVNPNRPLVEGKKIYLNGNPGIIRPSVSGKGADVVVDDKVIATGYLTGYTIYGGGPAGTHVESSRVTVDGVQIGGVNVFGGGEGSYDQSEDPTLVADVDNAVVIVNGNSRLNNVFGGGSGKGTVKKATVVINGGTFSSILGGGMAYVDNEHNIEEGASVNPENSANRVENAVVIINNASMNVNGLVYGGCQGYGCVENTDVTVNNIDGTKAWVIGGGSNGYVGNAKITINNAKAINSVCNINRGWAKSAKMVINGGTITNVYAGADEEDNKTSAMEHHGCQGTLEVEINGGTITTLAPGYNYTAINADDPKVKVHVAKGATVTNLETAKTSFGTSLTVEE